MPPTTVYGVHKIDPCDQNGGSYKNPSRDGKVYAGNIVAVASGVPGEQFPIYVCDKCGKQFDAPESSDEIHRDASLNLPGFKSKPPKRDTPVYLANGARFGLVLASIRELPPGSVGGHDNVWEVIVDAPTTRLSVVVRWERLRCVETPSIRNAPIRDRYVYAVCDRIIGAILNPRGGNV